MIHGHCTHQGSSRFKQRFPNLPDSHFSISFDLFISSIGLGTYLGDESSVVGRMTAAAAFHLMTSGCNVLDTAPNYRDGMSEATIGQIMEKIVRETDIGRDELFIMTKVGILSESSMLLMEASPSLMAFHPKVFDRCYCFDPEFIRWQIGCSLKTMGLDTIDCVFLHNIEILLLQSGIGRNEFYDAFRWAVDTLEDLCCRGIVRMYGIATWNGFRVGENDPSHICLHELLLIARSIGGESHHFRAVQLPFGLWGPEALTVKNQARKDLGGRESILAAVTRASMAVFVNSALLQGELLGHDLSFLPDIDGFTSAQKAIQFSRNIPGITSVLVGIKTLEHCQEAVDLFARGRELSILNLLQPI